MFVGAHFKVFSLALNFRLFLSRNYILIYAYIAVDREISLIIHGKTIVEY